MCGGGIASVSASSVALMGWSCIVDSGTRADACTDPTTSIVLVFIVVSVVAIAVAVAVSVIEVDVVVAVVVAIASEVRTTRLGLGVFKNLFRSSSEGSCWWKMRRGCPLLT